MSNHDVVKDLDSEEIAVATRGAGRHRWREPRRSMLDEKDPPLTPRHWGVLGIVRLTAGRPISPERIAKELQFDVEEVVRLLADLQARGYVRRLPPE